MCSFRLWGGGKIKQISDIFVLKSTKMVHELGTWAKGVNSCNLDDLLLKFKL